MTGKYLPPGFEWNHRGWDDLLADVVENECVPRAHKVADACNDASAADGAHAATTTDEERRGYKVSVEGSKPLQRRKWRATVITATNPAKADNARHNRLVSEFHRAEG